ncbi:MAG: hypothetical protein J6Y71_01280 [Ruminococcus sp.]|nr:hypothetical protein [Ruminococcus sp.]
MFDKLDIVLALALAGFFAFLLYKMMSFDKHLDDQRENSQFYYHKTSWEKREINDYKLKKYGVVSGIMIICLIYTVLRLNGTIGNIFSFFF